MSATDGKQKQIRCSTLTDPANPGPVKELWVVLHTAHYGLEAKPQRRAENIPTISEESAEMRSRQEMLRSHSKLQVFCWFTRALPGL